MTILVGSDVPGLLTALEQRLGGSQQLTVLRDADALMTFVRNPGERIEALILNDSLTPPATTDVATALWNITSFVARSRQPCIPTVITLRDDTPPAVYEALRAEAQQTGGELRLVSHGIRNPDQAEAQQAVAWITAQLPLPQQRRRYTILALNNTGGAGTTSVVMHLCLQLTRLGLRVLVVDCELFGYGITSWLRVGRENGNERENAAEPELAQRIVHHAAGLDVLWIGNDAQVDSTAPQPDLDTLPSLLEPCKYDVIAFDGLDNWQTRPDIATLLAQPNASPLVVCSPGMKERTGTGATLAALGAIKCSNNQTALDRAMVVFLEGERGQTKRIREVREAVLAQFPSVTDLGALPRDPALISLAAEQPEFISPFDLAPKRPYCHAFRHVARQWIEAVEVPATWLTRYDPDERRERQFFWSLRRGQKRQQSRPSQIEQQEQSLPLPEPVLSDAAANDEVEAQPILAPVLADAAANDEVDTQASTLPLPADVAEPIALGTAPWLDEALHLNRARTRRSVVAFEQQE